MMLEFLHDYFRFEIWGFLNVLAGFLNLALGLGILLKNPRDRANRMYFLITIAAFFWVVGFGLASLVDDPRDAKIWIALAYLMGVPFISPVVHHFSAVWTGNEKAQRLLFPTLSVAVVLALIWFFFPDQIWTTQEMKWGNRFDLFLRTPTALSYLAAILLFMAFLSFSTFRNFLTAYKLEGDPFRRQQLRMITIGYAIGYTGALDFLSAYNGRVYPIGFVALTLLTTITAYTIVRHRFLDVKIVIRKVTLALSIYTFLLIVTIAAGVPVARQWLDPLAEYFFLKIALLSVGMGLILSFGPLIYAFFVRHSFWLRTQESIGLTHELKSPLATIQSALGELNHNLRMPTPNVDQSLVYAGIASKNSERLRLFVDNLLNIVRINEGAVEITKSPWDLVGITQETVETYREPARLKGLQVELNFASSVTVMADGDKMRQALSNILSNAVKYSDSGLIRVSITKENGHAVVKTTDKGKGIDPVLLPRVFDKFVQGHKSGAGTGIGLAIAKAWVEAHGGRIWAESEGEGKGTTVTFTVPS